MRIKLVLFLLLWAIIFFIAGLGVSARANTWNCSNTVTKVLVEKSNKKMYLLNSCGDKIKEYAVRIGIDGKKQCEGDKKTPEGVYHIIDKYGSKYVRFLALDYPNKQDRKNAKELGCNPGDGVGIHAWIEGLPRSNSRGCITVWTKQEILEIYKLVKVGTEVEILP